MIRTASIAVALIAGTLLPLESAQATTSINGQVSQVVNALRYGSSFSNNNFAFSIQTGSGSQTLFTGLAGVRAFNDFGALNDFVSQQHQTQSVYNGGQYQFTHGVLGSYFNQPSPQPAAAAPAPMMMSARSFAEPAAAVMPVPEPAAWMMLIGGFALAGAAMRHRRNVALPA